MFNRRQFLTRTLRGSSLVALGRWCRSSWPGRPRPPRRARTTSWSSRADRRQRRPQHRHPLRRRPLPQGPADAAADEGRRSSASTTTSACTPACRASGRCGRGPAGGRAGRRLPEPRPLALRGDGHLAVGRPEAARPRPAGWAAAAVEMNDRSGGVPILHVGPGKPAAGRWPARRAAGRSPSTTRTRSASSSAAAGRASRRPGAGCCEESATPAGEGGRATTWLSFVQRRQVQTLTAVETCASCSKGRNAVPRLGQRPQPEAATDRRA